MKKLISVLQERGFALLAIQFFASRYEENETTKHVAVNKNKLYKC